LAAGMRGAMGFYCARPRTPIRLLTIYTFPVTDCFTVNFLSEQITTIVRNVLQTLFSKTFVYTKLVHIFLALNIMWKWRWFTKI